MSCDMDEISNICVSCGMCCDGALFHKANIKDDDDRKLAESMGFKIVTDGSRQAFLQPCHHFNCHCTVYSQPRPSVCGAYFCEPIRKAKRQEITTYQARELISKAVSLKRKFNQVCLNFAEFSGKSIPQIQKALNFDQLPKAEQIVMRQKYAQVLLIGIKLFPLIHEIIGPRKKKKKSLS